MAAPIESVLHLGFRFRFDPKPRDAVAYYLPRLVAGLPMHAAIRPFVHATDIYACEPRVLAARFRPTPRTGDRFFFATFKRQPQKAGKSIRAVRAAGPGYWHPQGHATDVIDDAGAKIGEVKKLRYKKGGKFTDWLMDEFSSCSQDTVVGDRQYVLCKIYVSPRARPDSVARQESDAFAIAPPPAPEEEEPIVVAARNSNKRPAPPVAEPPCPTKRIRPSAVPISTPPPVVQPPSPLPVQQPAPHHFPPPPPSIQASAAAQAAPCSPVAARDPFCMEESPAAAAQEHDGADFDWEKFYEEHPLVDGEDGDDCDHDFAKSLEGSLEFLTEPAEEQAPAEVQDDDVDLDFAKSLDGSLETEPAEEQAPAETQDDLDFAKSLEDSLETEPTEAEADDWFAPLMQARERTSCSSAGIFLRSKFRSAVCVVLPSKN